MARCKPLTETQVTERANALKDFDPEKAAAELAPRNADAARSIRDREDEGQRLRDAIDSAMNKVKATIQSEREQAAYAKIGIDKRVTDVVLPTIVGLDTDQKMNEFNTAVGGQFRRLDNIESLRTSDPNAKINQVAGVMGSADGKSTDSANSAFEQFDSTKQHRTDALSEIDKRQGTDSGDMYAARLLTRAKTDYVLNAKSQGYEVQLDSSLMDKIQSFADNKDKHLADAAYDELDSDFRTFLARRDLPGDVRERVSALYQEFKAKVGDKDAMLNTVSPGLYSANIASFARSFGLLLSDTEAQNFNPRPAGSQSPGAVAPPAPAVPSPVVNLNAPAWGNITRRGANTADVTWIDTNEGKAGTRVERSDDDGKTWHVVSDLQPGSNELLDRTLVPNTSPLYRLIATPPTSAAPDPSPQPSAPPPGPHADASAVHHHYEHTEYHTHYGNAFFSNGEDEFPDLRGPAET